MTDNIVWEDPPPKAGTGGIPGTVGRFVAQLQEHPGKWAKFGTFPDLNKVSGQAAYLRRRYGCQIAIRGRSVYARWPDE